MASIFTTETVIKSNLYQRIKDLLVGAGWQNISSKPATDFDVFYSKGVAGDKELYFQLQDPGGLFTTGTQAYISSRMINKYTPGTSGVAGTFDIPSGWVNIHLFSSATVVPDTPITLNYTVNADRIVFITEPPLALSSVTSSNIVYIGAMSLYESEPNGRSLVLAQAFYNNTQTSAPAGILVNSSPYSDTTIPYIVSPYILNTLGEYNNNDVRMLSEIAVGSPTEGLRGVLDGLYSLYSNTSPRTTHGDILTDGTKTYKVIRVTQAQGAGWFRLIDSPNLLYAIQIS